MKTRLGFVSNSSSSSCILAATEITRKVTVQVVLDALTQLFDEKRLHEHMDECARTGTEACQLFEVMEPDTADKEYGQMLADWISPYARRNADGTIQPCPDAEAAEDCWLDFIDELKFARRETKRFFSKGWELLGCCEPPDALRDMCRYNEKKGAFDYRKVPKGLADILSAKWKELGLCTNRDVLRGENALLFIHFLDNEIYSIRGMTDKEGWSSDSWTGDRFLEVLLTELQRVGVIDGSVSLQDFIHKAVLTLNMHEG